VADLKLVELQSLTAWPRRTAGGASDTVPDLSPEAEAALRAGDTLPSHMGLELWGGGGGGGARPGPSSSPQPSVVLCDDFSTVPLAECVSADMLPSKGDVALDRPASAGGASCRPVPRTPCWRAALSRAAMCPYAPRAGVCTCGSVVLL
jgi:hypothetical protein